MNPDLSLYFCGPASSPWLWRGPCGLWRCRRSACWPRAATGAGLRGRRRGSNRSVPGRSGCTARRAGGNGRIRSDADSFARTERRRAAAMGDGENGVDEAWLCWNTVSAFVLGTVKGAAPDRTCHSVGRCCARFDPVQVLPRLAAYWQPALQAEIIAGAPLPLHEHAYACSPVKRLLLAMLAARRKGSERLRVAAGPLRV